MRPSRAAVVCPQCFNWQQTQSCEYGDRCRFLHGEDDDGARFERREKVPRGLVVAVT